MRKHEDLKELSAGELEEKEKQLRQELYNLRFQKETGQLENTGRIRVLKRMIARVRTLLTAKGMSEVQRSADR